MPPEFESREYGLFFQDFDTLFYYLPFFLAFKFVFIMKWSEVTWSEVWWPILGICALHLTHPKCTHISVNTHTPWTHTRSSGQPFMLRRPGAVGGSVPCSRAPQSWYWGWRERCTFTPPTYNSCRPETEIRPRLPPYIPLILTALWMPYYFWNVWTL